MASSYPIDPQARLDYYVDWSAWLADGETITTSTWTVSNYDDTAPDISDTIDSDTAPGVWVTDTTLGDKLRLTCHIITSEGREDDRTLSLIVKQR
jgi:hypothetical protein